MSSSNGRRVVLPARVTWRDRVWWWARGLVVVALFGGSWLAVIAFAHWLESLIVGVM